METVTTFALGVTGGIGSGKSAVCQVLEALGARVFYADAEAKRLMEEDASLRRAVQEAFGADSYLPSGALNRAHLARLIFGHKQQVERLNALVHPKVREAFAQAKARAVRDRIPVLVHEAALIFESGADAALDAVAVVDAPQETRMHRVMDRDGASEEQVRARMRHQWPASMLRQRANYVIDNSGRRDALRPQVEQIYRAIMQASTPALPQ